MIEERRGGRERERGVKSYTLFIVRAEITPQVIIISPRHTRCYCLFDLSPLIITHYVSIRVCGCEREGEGEGEREKRVRGREDIQLSKPSL